MMFPLTNTRILKTQKAAFQTSTGGYGAVFLVATLNITQQCVLVAMKPNHMLSSTSKNVSSRLREVIISHCLTSESPHLECCAQFGAPQHGRQMDKLKQGQWKDHQGGQGLWLMRYRRGWAELGLSSLDKGRLRPLTAVLSYLILVIKKAERTQFAGKKLMITYKEKKSQSEGVSEPEQVAQSGCEISVPEDFRTWLGKALVWLWSELRFEQEVGLDDLKRAFPN